MRRARNPLDRCGEEHHQEYSSGHSSGKDRHPTRQFAAHSRACRGRGAVGDEEVAHVLKGLDTALTFRTGPEMTFHVRGFAVSKFGIDPGNQLF
jgi:hypothetical protein